MDRETTTAKKGDGERFSTNEANGTNNMVLVLVVGGGNDVGQSGRSETGRAIKTPPRRAAPRLVSSRLVSPRLALPADSGGPRALPEG